MKTQHFASYQLLVQLAQILGISYQMQQKKYINIYIINILNPLEFIVK
jgi:hypothetical protein